MLVFHVVLRAVLLWLFRPLMPVVMAGLDYRTVWRFTGAGLGQGFLLARSFPTCVFVQTVFLYSWRFCSCSSSRSSVTLSRFSLSLSAGPWCQASCTAWAIPGGAVPGQVVLARRCATPGAVFVDDMVTAPLLEVSFVLRVLCCCCFSVLFACFVGTGPVWKVLGFRADPVLVSFLYGDSVLYYAVAIVLFTSLESHIDGLHRPV